MVEIITAQARPLDVLIIFLLELRHRKTFETVDKRSNMHIAGIKSKPIGVKSLRYIIDLVIGARFYPPPGP